MSRSQLALCISRTITICYFCSLVKVWSLQIEDVDSGNFKCSDAHNVHLSTVPERTTLHSNLQFAILRIMLDRPIAAYTELGNPFLARIFEPDKIDRKWLFTQVVNLHLGWSSPMFPTSGSSSLPSLSPRSLFLFSRSTPKNMTVHAIPHTQTSARPVP